MEDRKVLLSVKDLQVKFRVRGRILTAIRGVSLDIYEDESIAIVGESGAGKSVFTKAFAGMLDANGFIDQGDIIFNDPELDDTVVPLNSMAKKTIDTTLQKLNEYSKLEAGASIYREIQSLEKEKQEKSTLSEEEKEKYDSQVKELIAKRTEIFNMKQTLDPSREKAKIKEAQAEISKLDTQIKAKQKEKEQKIREHHQNAAHDTAYHHQYNEKITALRAEYEKAIKKEITPETVKRNEILAKEIYLSVGRYHLRKRTRMVKKLLEAFKRAMQLGVDIMDESQRNAVFDNVTFRVRYLDETPEQLHGTCIINLAKIKDANDWGKIRGKKIATVFQDPMTSLNPIITIGKQITSIIMKHQECSEVEARAKALELMEKVGIPNAEARFDDYPFQYSGGMRQRIVIAIALSCQPKILICDEPTTALDVTIQAQILKLIKDLQKEFHYTIVFITHDLGVVANVADRVAVLYAGQVIELATVEELFYDPRHPYTWALLSSLPQLAERNTKLYSITGTPPSLYNKIVGDSFAPRNPYCLKIDTLAEPPMFKVSDTHYAKTWLLDPHAPKVEKPEAIQNIHEKLLKAYNI
ncbi:MAG: oligopeptide/dipeptide ABC transporter ATP-binding protein [Fusicatenibacter sp.]|nr:ATP-binding cassette domain-containing protein [Fusicatenibacter sp.]